MAYTSILHQIAILRNNLVEFASCNVRCPEIYLTFFAAKVYGNACENIDDHND